MQRGTCLDTKHGNIMSYNLRIIQEYFQPKIARKIRILSLGWKNNILIEKKECIAFRVSPLRKSKGYTLGSGMTPTQSEKKKKNRSMPAA